MHILPARAELTPGSVVYWTPTEPIAHPCRAKLIKVNSVDRTVHLNAQGWAVPTAFPFEELQTGAPHYINPVVFGRKEEYAWEHGNRQSIPRKKPISEETIRFLWTKSNFPVISPLMSPK